MKKIFYAILIILFIGIYYFISNYDSKNGDFGLQNNINNEKYIKDNFSVNNIILITVDILRADHLGYYGYPMNTSPFIDELAKNSINFENAFANISITAGSDATIFTSLYPLQHKVFSDYMKLDDSFLTMAEILKKKGFQTGAFIGSNHLKHANLLQGFDKIDVPEDLRAADKTFDSALEWLEGKKENDKVFTWIHLYDLNRKFDLREEFRTEIIKSMDNIGKNEFIDEMINDGKISLICKKNLDLEDSESIKTREELLDLIIKYDSKIKFIDKELEKFYNRINEGKLNNDALWLLTAEHGDGLCGHSYFSHGYYIYDEQLHVPLLMHFPNKNKSKVINNIVEHVDILPTITDLTFASTEKQIKPIQGISLFNLINEENSFPEKYVFSQKRYHYEKEKNMVEKSTIPVFSLRDKNYKYIYNERKKDEFYDLTKDPNEQNNIINYDLKVINEFKEEIIKRIKKYREDDDKGELLFIHEEEAIKYLESVGYHR